MSKEHESKELHPAEIAKLEAEQRKIQVETEWLEARRDAELIHLRARAEEEQQQNASDYDNLVYVLSGSIDGVKARAARSILMGWHRRYPGADIEIVISSPGGSVFDGFLLYDAIKYLSRHGHKITTVASGYAASMAGILLQAGDVRAIGTESYVMLHEVSTGAMGKASELGDVSDLAKRLTHQAAEIFGERSVLSVDEIEDRLTRRDWWVSAKDALAYGFVDEIR